MLATKDLILELVLQKEPMTGNMSMQTSTRHGDQKLAGDGEANLAARDEVGCMEY